MLATAQFYTIDATHSSCSKITGRVAVDSVINQSVSNIDKRGTISEPSSLPVSSSSNWIHSPLPGKLKISSRFGKRRNPFGKNASETHNGLDLSAPAGTPIYAMLPGTVDHIGYDARSGNYIKLRHGNFTVSYCHLIRKPSIAAGSRVIPGMTVAHVGSTGRSTGPHLHITFKHNGKLVDPSMIINMVSN